MILPALFCLIAQDAKLELAPMPSGLFNRIHGYRPLGITLSEAKPASVTKAPDGAVRYGTVTVAGREFVVAKTDSKLYVDSNGNGDLTDDPSTVWNVRPATATASREGTFTVDIPIEGKIVACTFGVYEIQDRPDMLGAYADFALSGSLTLAGKKYDVIYSDTSGKWNGSGELMIDKDADGRFSPNYEFYRANAPFNIGGVTYEFRAADGAFALAKSSQTVEERTAKNSVPPDPNLANGLVPGKAALPFEATTMGKRKLSFPKSYSGKLVLLDFWATWCGPCMREVPNVVKAYTAYHDQGFEVLGISLDRAKAEEQITTVTGKQGMVWDQIYDGNYFDAAIAKQYQIKSIPATYLIDGDTGKIVASGEALRGDRLAETVKQALAKRKTTSK